MITVARNIDSSCDMAQVLVDGVVVFEGNFWDFHPGCHGSETGILAFLNGKTWKGSTSLTQLIVERLRKSGNDVTIELNGKYTYE